MNWTNLFLLFFLSFLSCQQLEWETRVVRAGTNTSLRVSDLNGDGVKDIVLGAGGTQEWEASENGVIAINGQNGEVLWKVSCQNQIVGCPVFLDITGDGIDDVFIGGRSAQFFAIDGMKGTKVWEFEAGIDRQNREDTTILNFFSPQLIPDQDRDGMQDLLISYGGFVNAQPWEKDRPVGYLMVFSTANGKTLAKVAMPDGKETYMTPVVYQNNIYFGTGGETIPGSFYVTPLGDLFDGLLNEATELIKGKKKGFIAPPVLVDLNADEVLDIIINAYEGRTIALNGKNKSLLWEVSLGTELETHSQPAVGQFTGDPTPDLFVNYGQGTWPDIKKSYQVVIDGKTGEHQVMDSLGSLQYASPIAVTGNDPHYDEVLLPVNVLGPSGYPVESGYPATSIRVQLIKFNPADNSHKVWYETKGSNLGATVLLDDLDGNGSNELLFVYNHNPFSFFEHTGLSVHCFPAADYQSTWNQYMGQDGRSVFSE